MDFSIVHLINTHLLYICHFTIFFCDPILQGDIRRGNLIIDNYRDLTIGLAIGLSLLPPTSVTQHQSPQTQLKSIYQTLGILVFK